MAKYIDAEIIRNEVIKHIEDNRDIHDGYALSAMHECEEILSFLDSLQPEKQEVDLEKELADYCRRYYNYDYPKQAEEGTGSSVMPHIIEAAKYFYELGKNSK